MKLTCMADCRIRDPDDSNVNARNEVSKHYYLCMSFVPFKHVFFKNVKDNWK